MASVDIDYNLTDFWNIFDMGDDDGPVIDELEVTQFLSESNSVRNVFPEEVWFKILDRVTAPEDLLCLSNSSTYFRQILNEERVIFLFPQVVEALAPQYEKDQVPSCYREEPKPIPELDPINDLGEDPDDFFSSEDEDTSPRPIFVSLNGHCHHFLSPEAKRMRKNPHYMTGIMKCRLVCISWNKAIENHYQKPTKMVYKHSSGRDWEVHYFSCGDTRRSPRGFMEHFEQSHNQLLEKKNPFLGRSVQIRVSTPGECEREFVANLNRALVAFGEEIWYCTIIIPVADAIEKGTCAQTYSRLKWWLHRMPNLKRLIIKSDPNDENHPIIKDTQRLVEEIGVNPMPTLEHLEFLEVNDVPAQISNELIRANNNICGLRLKRRKYTEQVGFSLFNVKYCYEAGYKFLGDLSRLKTLQIVPFWEDCVEADSELAPYLEILKVRCFTGSSMGWERELKVIENKWGGNLKELVLKMGSSRPLAVLLDEDEEKSFMELSEGCKLKLEKLERLTVYLYRPTQLDFLLPLKSNLKWIGFVMKYVHEEEMEETNRKKEERKQSIEFFGFESCMEKSNIWDIFTELKMVQVKNDMQSDGNPLTLFKRPRK